MYREFYGMKHQPFSRNVPSEALYESKAMTEALGRLAYVADRQLFTVVTADAGCGKSRSTLCSKSTKILCICTSFPYLPQGTERRATSF